MRATLLASAAFSVLFLASCGMQESATMSDGSSESLLNARGSWAMVEEDSEPSYDAHEKAKEKVNVNDMHAHMAYAKKLRGSLKKDTNFRLLRLERQMSDVNRTLEKALPGYVAREYPDYASLGMKAPKEAVMDREAVRAPSDDKSKVVHKPSMAGPIAVQRVRFGEHPGKTRLVLDLNKPSKFSYDLDNGEKLLLVNVMGSGWKAAEVKKLSGHPLIANYSAHDDGQGGTMLVLELKKSVKVLKTMALDPNKDGYHRIVLDLAAQ